MAIQMLSSSEHEFAEHHAAWVQKGCDPGVVTALYPLLTGTLREQRVAERFLSRRITGLGEPSDPQTVHDRNAIEMEAMRLVEAHGLAPTPVGIIHRFDPIDASVNLALDSNEAPRIGLGGSRPRVADDEADQSNSVKTTMPRRFGALEPSVDTSLW